MSIRLIRPKAPLDYAQFLRLQDHLVKSKLPLVPSPSGGLVKNESVIADDYLIVTSHPPTYTVGRRVSEDDYRRLRDRNTGADIFKVELT